ncbi:MAG: hydantoinase/oxoprolinase family protein [Deltaproteobacteria bacterium]|nr:hydantoinase/oxoprolinase family protein [Deltaproteobacteria bacterium]
MTTQQSFVVGVDTGGTFTDVVVLTEAGEVVMSKAPTTPWDFSIGVLDAIGEAARQMGLSPRDLLARTAMLKHGSTVATNALITRSGVRVGFITTSGFEDTTLIMRAIGRVDGLPEQQVRHTMFVTKPEPLVPRERIRGVKERVDYPGQVLVPLDLEAVRQAVHELVEEEKVEALAVSLLHAWANPVHERAIRDLARNLLPDKGLYWCFGSDLSQVAGEYARANTAILNSYVGPTVQRYLGNLEEKLRAGSFHGPLLIMQGNGGVAHREQVTPIANLQSGPAGGMIASAYVAGLMGHRNVITTDMGGTSFDVGLITEGYWRYAQEPIFERFRILQPIIDVESIGAGGGTIARVEPGTGRLLVGPESAGASPGPVCYDQGGEEVTVTDADLMLGIIDPHYFLGGRQVLNMEKARRAIEERIARPLGLAGVEAAAGIYDIINSKMSDLIRRQVVRTGYLPEEFVLYAFGGAGPVHAAGFAAEMGIGEIYIFASSPVFSAFGIAAADVVHTRVVSCQYRLPADPEVLNQRLESIEAELDEAMTGEGFRREEVSFRRFFTMRYRRQTAGVEIPIPWARFSEPEVARLQEVFEKKYEELYGVGAGYTKAGIEVSAVRVDAVGLVEKPVRKPQGAKAASASAAIKGRRPVFFTRPERRFIDTSVYEYGLLGTGHVVPGPAIIELPFTTTLVPPASRVSVDDYRNLVMEVR